VSSQSRGQILFVDKRHESLADTFFPTLPKCLAIKIVYKCEVSFRIDTHDKADGRARKPTVECLEQPPVRMSACLELDHTLAEPFVFDC